MSRPPDPSPDPSPDPTLDPVDQPRAVDLRDYVRFDLERPSGVRVFATDIVAVDLLCLEPGQALDARVRPGADSVYTVLGGRAWVVVDDAEVTLEPLQAIMIPSGAAHGIRNESPDPLILHVVESPPEDL